MERKKLKCLIVDADVNSLRDTTRIVTNHPDLEVLNTCKTGRAAYNSMAEGGIDLIFMNPALPDANGFDLVDSLKEKPYVIILSDRPDYAFFAYRIDAVDYRLKPLNADRLNESLERVYQRIQMREAYEKR